MAVGCVLLNPPFPGGSTTWRECGIWVKQKTPRPAEVWAQLFRATPHHTLFPECVQGSYRLPACPAPTAFLSHPESAEHNNT